MTTRLFDAPHGQLHEFEKRLQAAGLTAEHVKMLLADDLRLRAWVAKVDENVDPEPPHTRVPIEAAFGGTNGVVCKLQRMEFVYLHEVAELTERELLNVTGFGQTTLGKIRTVLSRHGLQFSETYHEPSPLVHSDYGSRYCCYRPRIPSATIWGLVRLSRLEDRAEDYAGPDNTTFGEYMAMSLDERRRVLSESGIAKVDTFIAKNYL